MRYAKTKDCVWGVGIKDITPREINRALINKWRRRLRFMVTHNEFNDKLLIYKVDGVIRVDRNHIQSKTRVLKETRKGKLGFKKKNKKTG